MSLQISVFLLLTVALALTAAVLYIASRARETPEKRERKRRQFLHSTGRVGDAMITEVAENTLFYNYSVRGVQYETSQDVTLFRHELPEDLERLIGPALLKYAVRNPENSIVICENWSGLRNPAPKRATLNAEPLLLAPATAIEPERTIKASAVSSMSASADIDAERHQA